MAPPVSTAKAAFFEAAEKRLGGGLVRGRPDAAIRDDDGGLGWKDQREPACEQGVKVQDISRFLDHASVDHTMRYLQSMEDDSGALGNL